MANKKKTTDIQEAPQTEEAITTEEKTPAEGIAPTEEEQPEQGAPAAEGEPHEAPPTEEEQEPSERTCPFETTVGVSLAVLRKSIGPGTEDMLKPVATLKQGTKVTVVAVYGQNARLRNGLWIALDNLAK